MPFLRNAWYVGALADELGEQPLARVVLDEPLVFFRDRDGTPAALADRCPHRFVPLSLGRVIDSRLQCGYHGLRFGADGACVDNPHGKKLIPRGARVRAYPVVERNGFVWIWPGDASLADRAAVPEYAFLDDSTLAHFHGVLRVAGNYELIVDNLLDLSHIEFLHPMLSQGGGVAAHRTEFVQDGDTVISNRWRPNVPLSAFFKRFWTSSTERADTRSNMRWTAPARLLHDVGATEVGAPIAEGFTHSNIHLITPETELTSYYFWGSAYNRLVDDAEVLRQVREATKTIFETQDGVMIAAQQRAMGKSADLIAQRPIMLEPDEPAIRARRVVARLIAEEGSVQGRAAVDHDGLPGDEVALGRA